jgi:hypothetical protein
MPFQSEKQRRYLWANEPEIARDWSDTYGHRAQGYDGGVMRVPFQTGQIASLFKGHPLYGTERPESFNRQYNLSGKINSPAEREAINQINPAYLPYMEQRSTTQIPYNTGEFDWMSAGKGAEIFPRTELGSDLQKQMYLETMGYGRNKLGEAQQSGITPKGISYNLHKLPYDEVTNQYDRIGTGNVPVEGNKIEFQNQQDQGLAWHGQPTLQKMFQAEDFPLRGNIEKTKQGLGELWQSGKEKAGGIWDYAKEKGIQGQDLLMGGLGAVTGVPLGLMNLMRKGIRPDTEYETYQKQMMGVPTTGQQAGKDPWGQNIRSLKGGYDVEDQWDKFAASTLGQKYNLAEIGMGGITKEEEEELRRQGLKGWQLQRALGLSKYGGKAAAWKKRRQIAGQKQEKDRYKRVREAEAAQKQRAAQAAMAAQQAASVEQAYQHQTGAGSGYSGGERTDPHGITSYHDPFDPGGGE